MFSGWRCGWTKMKVRGCRCILIQKFKYRGRGRPKSKLIRILVHQILPTCPFPEIHPLMRLQMQMNIKTMPISQIIWLLIETILGMAGGSYPHAIKIVTIRCQLDQKLIHHSAYHQPNRGRIQDIIQKRVGIASTLKTRSKCKHNLLNWDHHRF